MPLTAVLAIASDRLPALIAIVFLAIIMLSVVALVLATISGTRAAGRTERNLAELAERVADLDRRVRAIEASEPSTAKRLDQPSVGQSRGAAPSRWWARRAPRTVPGHRD